MTTVIDAFNEFKEAIQPTEYQWEHTINARKDRVTENLTAAFPVTSDMPLMRVDLIGSAAKKTIIRPIDDIDVLAIFSDTNNVYENTYVKDSQKFLYRVRNAYDGLSTATVGARGQAVRVFFQTHGHVDVAPVFWKGESDYLLPAGDGTWITTSPQDGNKWFDERNTALSNNLAGLVRLLKTWNRNHSKRFKSFHMETVAGSVFSSLSTSSRENLKCFFEWAPSHLSVGDPGGHSSDLSSYLTSGARTDLIQSLMTAYDRSVKAIAAENSGDHTEAKRLWAITLGDSFPT